MKMQKLLLGCVLSLASMTSACSPPQKVPPVTHVARVHLEPGRYPEFLSRLDAEMAHVRLSRYGATPGLSELHGRDVLYFNFRPHLSDVGWFLSVDDIVKIGVIEIFIYTDFFKDEKDRTEAMTRLAAVLNAFGARLEERSEKNFGPKMDLKVYDAK